MKQWGEKRYHSLDFYLKETFGEKVYKLSLNGGMTCPNRDGTLDTRGCIFCSQGGSGDFASDKNLTMNKQIEEAKKRIKNKTSCSKFIAYFQAFTNTYAPLEYLKDLFYETIHHPDIVCLSIATRPDCLEPPVLSLLKELNQIKPVWIELGLQTIHPDTAQFIRRGYSLDCFTRAVYSLKERKINTIAHVILGLPYLNQEKVLLTEKENRLLETIQFISQLPIDGIKLQLLHILKHTDLSKYIDQIEMFTLLEYTGLIIKCIERLPEAMVIHRLTGDGPGNLLLSPLWGTDKKRVLNEINRSLKMQDTWQGKLV